MKNLLLLVILISLGFLSACKKIPKDDVEPYKGKSYFPTNTGHELIYEVESIKKNQISGQWDTAFYEIKETITGSFIDSVGRETQIIERYIKNDTTSNFVPYKTWAANLLTSTAHRIEDNIRFIKLVFPQNPGGYWDANSLNNLGVRYYRYTALHEPSNLMGLAYDSTCTILQFADSSLTQNKYYLEKYATKVGMIYKINQELTFDLTGAPINGFIYKETLVSHQN